MPGESPGFSLGGNGEFPGGKGRLAGSPQQEELGWQPGPPAIQVEKNAYKWKRFPPLMHRQTKIRQGIRGCRGGSAGARTACLGACGSSAARHDDHTRAGSAMPCAWASRSRRALDTSATPVTALKNNRECPPYRHRVAMGHHERWGMWVQAMRGGAPAHKAAPPHTTSLHSCKTVDRTSHWPRFDRQGRRGGGLERTMEVWVAGVCVAPAAAAHDDRGQPPLRCTWRATLAVIHLNLTVYFPCFGLDRSWSARTAG